MENKPTYAELEKRVHELEQTNTACRQQLTELRETENRFRRLWEQSPLGYQSLDAQGRFVEVNQSWIDILGYTREEVVGRSFADFLHPDWREHFRINFPRFKAIGEILGVEFEMLKKDGAFITVSFNGKIGKDDRGQFRQTHCVFYDITERRQVEAALRRSEERWNAAIENFGEGAIIATETEQLIYWNPAARAMHGFICEGEGTGPLEEMSETFELWTPDGARLLTFDEWPMRRIKRGETVRKMELRLRRPDQGWERIVAYSGAMVHTASGESLIFLSVNDLSEQRNAETALRASEERFRQLADAMPQLVWTAEPDGQVDYYNERYMEYRGIEKLTDGNYRWDPVLHPEDVVPTVQAWQDACQSGKMYQIEHRVQMKTGGFRWHLSRAIPIYDAQGRVIKWFGTATDIGTVKQAEDELRRLNETLEQKVLERTAIAEARATQLRSLAVELIETEERERRQFAHLLHDDLQQMLAAANMQLQVVSDILPNESALVEVGSILKASIEKSRCLSQALSPPVLYHSGLVGALQWLSLRMKEQFELCVELEVSTEPRLENVPLKTFLFRSVQELLFNVVKHSGVHRARVVLSGSEAVVSISVMDEGKGFDPGILNEAKAGFGLLAIRERASYIGGSLTIESVPGKGSRLTLSAPLYAPKKVNDKRQALSTQLQKQAPGASAQGFTRVLFADDHHIMRKGLVNLVSGQPHIEVVGEAANGQEALEQALTLRPDVVVMDISMPVMDGIEATRRIKAALPDVRVIGLSMHMDERSARSIRDAGADAYMVKTVSPKELLQAIYGSAKVSLHNEDVN